MTALRSVVCAMVGLVLLAASARGGWYSGEVVADNPVGYWRLGESTGPTASDSVGANDGGYGGGVTLGVPGAIVGGSDTAVSFDGSSGRVVVPFTAALNPPAYTAELWAKVDGGAGSWRSPLTNRDHLPPPGTGQRGYLFYAGTNNRWQFWGGTGTGWQSQNGPSVQDGEWAHLAGTYDGTTKRLYVNGLCVASAPAGLLQNTASNLHIGAGGDGGTEFYFNGDVDEVAVYDKALAGARVAQHYIAARYPSVRGRGVWPGADLLVYHLDEGFGTMAHDATPGPVDGTLNGPAWSGGRFGGALSFDDAPGCGSQGQYSSSQEIQG